MEREETTLAKAAASLTVEDFRYLEEHGMIEAPAAPSNVNTQVTNTQEQAEAKKKMRNTRKRRHVKHEWPDIGTILEADYHGIHYEAEVIAAPQYKSGKAVRILTGPGAGRICRSLSGAMLKATEAQRKEQGLGKKGVANGWDFWEVEHEQNN
ncbi:MAG: hypothetical protein KAX19_08385 [Candidatus Brocadiae bacterium]|nr:hypothetical protein [Candidatus Brocadiia bacterium]